MQKYLWPFLAALQVCLWSCQDKQKQEAANENISAPAPTSDPLFVMRPSRATGITFVNQVTPNDSLNILDYNYFYNGGGVAIGDINNDSLPDIYFTGNIHSSKLYINKGNWKFEDVTQQAGVSTQHWATGVTMADVNNDGWLDMYVCFSAYNTPEFRTNKLFINKGDGTFSEKAKEYGLDFKGYSIQAAFLDYDRDGDQDMYLLTVYQDKTNPNLPRPKVSDGTSPSSDKLYRNNGNGTFTDVSKGAGILEEGYGLGIAISDINGDNWPDMYITNDFIYDDVLYVNNKNGTFSNQAKNYFKHTSRFAMGTDAADINNDGLVDIITLDMLPNDNRRQKLMNIAMNYDLFQYSLAQGYSPQYSRNTLQLNNGNGTFSEIGYLAGVYKTDWSWSALLADYDNDGWRDLFITNGIPRDITDNDFIKYRDTQANGPNFNYASLKKIITKMVDDLPEVKKHNFIFQNNGNLTFTDKTSEWGLSQPNFSNGAAYADLDNDGDLDLVVNQLNDEAALYENQTNRLFKNHYIKIRLANYPSPGAKVSIWQQGKMQFAQQYTTRGFQSAIDGSMHFGLGKDTKIDSLLVVWPDGNTERIHNVKADQILTLSYMNAKREKELIKQAMVPLFTDISTQNFANFRHIENAFVDFKFDPLLPQKYSQNGPALAVGDVNNDGLDDFCVGGSIKTPGKVFLQQSGGKFVSKDLPDPDYEDMGMLLFDADNDQDQDLYVASGGSEFNANTATYQDRLYKNDGKGNFTRDTEALPQVYASASCVTAADYDRDGDLDLCVGGRLIPGRYPLPARSYLLRNDGGRFTDVSTIVYPPLQQLGLVTSALWTDFDNDKQVDLILAGEWMPITFLKNTNGRFTNVTVHTGLNNTSGWWNSLTGSDFDKDGDMDYVAGNLGLNSQYKASLAQPVSVYAHDFDGNRTMDPVITHYIEGLHVPVASRDALVGQMVSMRKRFTNYAQYAHASIEDVLMPDERQQAYTAGSENFESCYIENHGNGKFSIRPLPVESQFAPVFGMLAQDFDGDENTDLLLTGNSYATEYVNGWYDASIGLYLKGDGKGNFTPASVKESGFFADGDCKSMVQLYTKAARSLVVVGRNNNTLKCFTTSATNKASTLISLQPADWLVKITLADGRKIIQEANYGWGYLSQSSRKFTVPASAKSITIETYQGEIRKIELIP